MPAPSTSSSGSLSITNVKIRPVVGRVIERGTIIIRDGTISEIRDEAEVGVAGASTGTPAGMGASSSTSLAAASHVIDGTGCTAT